MGNSPHKSHSPKNSPSQKRKSQRSATNRGPVQANLDSSSKDSQRSGDDSAPFSTAAVERQDRPKKKIILLGAGDSGKSTISKQIKLLQLGGYTRKEILSFAPTIRANALASIRSYLDEIPAERYRAIVTEPGAEALKDAVTLLKTSTTLTEEAYNAISTVWASPKVHQAWKGRLGTKETAKFFISNMDRIISPVYIPSPEDILRARAKTTGIIELTFSYSGYDITIIDVGGQRSERKKWAQCFTEVSAVIWCASLSEYDEVLYEDGVTNRLTESLELFESAVQSKWFDDADVIIFFNKDDLFRQKIAEVDLKICFEKYTGGKDYDKALDFIKKEYERRTAGISRVYSVVLTATDSSSVHKALAKVISVAVDTSAKTTKGQLMV